MEIIPGINCTNLACVKKRISQIKELGCSWVHLDIADGKFTKAKLWNDPKNYDSEGLATEVHLMVKDPEKEVMNWSAAGAQRIIVHFESIKNLSFENLNRFGMNSEIGVAINPETDVGIFTHFLTSLHFIQILAVKPGWSGQVFNPEVLRKVIWIKEQAPYVKVEVDGGINLETAKLAMRAGADVLVTSSYLFDSPDYFKAWDDLQDLIMNKGKRESGR